MTTRPWTQVEIDDFYLRRSEVLAKITIQNIPRGMNNNIYYLDHLDVFRAALFTFRYGFQIRILNDGPEFIPSLSKGMNVTYKCSVELKLPSGSVYHEVGYATNTRGKHGDVAKACYTDGIKRLFSGQGFNVDTTKLVQLPSMSPSPLPDFFYPDPLTGIRRLNNEEINSISQRLQDVLANPDAIKINQKGGNVKIPYLRGSQVSEVAGHVFSHGFSLTTVKEPIFVGGGEEGGMTKGLYKCIRKFTLHNGFSLDGVGYHELAKDTPEEHENACKACMTNADKTIFARLGVNVDSVREATPPESTPPRKTAVVTVISPSGGGGGGGGVSRTSSFVSIEQTNKRMKEEDAEVHRLCELEERKYEEMKKKQTLTTN